MEVFESEFQLFLRFLRGLEALGEDVSEATSSSRGRRGRGVPLRGTFLMMSWSVAVQQNGVGVLNVISQCGVEVNELSFVSTFSDGGVRH